MKEINLSDILSVEKNEKEKADEEKLNLENEFKKFEENYNTVLANQNKINLELEQT